MVEQEHSLKVQDIPVEDHLLHSLQAEVQADQDNPVDQMINIQDLNQVVTHQEDLVDSQLQEVELLVDLVESLVDNLVDSILQEDRDPVLDIRQLLEGQANLLNQVNPVINIQAPNPSDTQAADLLQVLEAVIHQEDLADSPHQEVDPLANLVDNLVDDIHQGEDQVNLDNLVNLVGTQVVDLVDFPRPPELQDNLADSIHQEDRDQVLDIHQLQEDQANLVNPDNLADTQVVGLADFHQLPVAELQDKLVDNPVDNILQEDKDPVQEDIHLEVHQVGLVNQEQDLVDSLDLEDFLEHLEVSLAVSIHPKDQGELSLVGLEVVMVTMDHTTMEIILQFLENLVAIIQSLLTYHKQVSPVILNNIQVTMRMLKLNVKFSTFVTTIKHSTSFVQMERSSIKNISCVYGGTSLIVTRPLACTI